jgi:hypothetical protein
MLPPLTIFPYRNFACMRLKVSPSRLPTSNTLRTTIVHCVLPEHFTSSMLRER